MELHLTDDADPAHRRAIETEVVRRGCRGLWLSTHSFQGRPFYERLGYRVLGRIDDYPPPFTRFYMARRLDSSGTLAENGPG